MRVGGRYVGQWNPVDRRRQASREETAVIIAGIGHVFSHHQDEASDQQRRQSVLEHKYGASAKEEETYVDETIEMAVVI